LSVADEGFAVPAELELAEFVRVDSVKLTLRIAGRWGDGRPRVEDKAFLVVQLGRRRHRFPGVSVDTGGTRSEWAFEFVLPAWLKQQLPGNAWLRRGEEVISLPELPYRRPAWQQGREARTVAALRAELKHRVAAKLRLRAHLAELRAELDRLSAQLAQAPRG
jgi:hypothetical protein